MHDTHAHLDLYLERLELLKPEENTLSPAAKDRLRQDLKNHSWLIQPTVSLVNFKRVRTLFGDLDWPVGYLLGAHPELVTSEFSLEGYVSTLESFLATLSSGELRAQVLGLGEIGLDYYYSQDGAVISGQKKLFNYHLRLAEDLNLPVVIHCREAFGDVFGALDEFPALQGRFLIHCFTGGLEELAEVERRGGYVAYGGVSTFKNAKELQETLPEVDSTRYVLETDLPFLSPHPKRGQTCRPEYVDLVAGHLAKAREVAPEVVWQQSEANVEALFGKKLPKTSSFG